MTSGTNSEHDFRVLPIDEIRAVDTNLSTDNKDCPTALSDLSDLAIQAALYKESNKIGGNLILLTSGRDGVNAMAIEARSSDGALKIANEFLDSHAEDIEAYSLVNFSVRQDHPKRVTPSQILIETGSHGALASFNWIINRESLAVFSSIKYYLTSTNRLKAAIDKLDLDSVMLGPTVRRLIVRVSLLLVGIFFIPYLLGKAICFLGILYLNGSFLFRRRLVLSKSGIQTKDTAYGEARTWELRDIECVREINQGKVIFMLTLKNKASGSGIRNSSELNDDEFKKVIQEYCRSCSIAYETMKG